MTVDHGSGYTFVPFLEFFWNTAGIFLSLFVLFSFFPVSVDHGSGYTFVLFLNFFEILLLLSIMDEKKVRQKEQYVKSIFKLRINMQIQENV